ncbi:MAG: hypothetical protein ACXWUG_18895 [Polyangiales bacterium]
MRASFWFAFACVCGCGGSSNDQPATKVDSGSDASAETMTTPSDTATDSASEVATDTADAAEPSRVPPKRPVATGTGTTKWFAFDSFQLGLADRATGTESSGAWKEYGFDLDGRVTSAADSAKSTNSCTRDPMSASAVLTDGTGGIDNNFGSQVMPLIKAVRADAEDYTNQGIQNGSWTLLLRLDNVGPDDNASVPGTLYVGHSFLGTGTPKFDESDQWTVAAESLMDGVDLAKARVRFPDGYMSGGVWVSGDFGKSTVPVALVMFGIFTIFPLEHGTITVHVADGSMGTIAGGTATKDLLEAFDPVVRSFGLCPGTSTYDFMQTTVKRSADLVSKAPALQDPTKPCDAISSGLGFTMKPTGVPSKVGPVPPAPADTCGP